MVRSLMATTNRFNNEAHDIMRRRLATPLHIVLMVAISLIAIGCSFYESLLLKEVQDGAVAKRSLERTTLSRMLKLEDLRDQLQFDVVQTQQFVSGFAATRGQDGLDEGLAIAAQYEKRFQANAAELKKIAVETNDNALRRGVSIAESLFPAFYKQGLQMAQAYAHEGTSAGNKLMPSFDDASERLQEILIGLTDLFERRRSEHFRVVDANNLHLDVLKRRVNSVGNLNMIFTLFACMSCMALVTRQIRKVQASAAAMRQARDEAENANHAKSTFLATMSHEIRTPMNGVIAMADDLLGKIHDPQLHEQVEIITNSGAHLLRIIDDILDLSKLDAKKMHLENVPFDIKAVIGSASEVFGYRARQQGVDITISLPESMPRVVIGDGVRLRQILFNLVSNAVKFTPGGKIDIDVALVGESADTPDPTFEFVVKDTGLGMTEEMQSYLFTEFWQADDSISRKYGGTGLGLAICFRLLKAMGGSIRVASKVGAGTTFAFKIPFKRATGEDLCRPELDAKCDVAVETNFAGRKILLSEDNPTNKKIAKIILAKTGARIDTADDGLEAVAAASSTKYDLILMDIHMPNMNGIEAAKAIRALAGPLGSVPIVALSASALPEERELCLKAGMNDFVPKPYRGDLLRAAIARALRGPQGAPKQGPKQAPGAREPRVFADPAFQESAYRVLAKEVGEADARELLAEFMLDARRLLEAIEGHAAARQLLAIKNDAHALKSSAAMLGLARLSEISAALEAAAAGEGWSEVAPLSLAANKAFAEAEPLVAQVLKAA
jgi:signal transduction histidine kinase/DNA-binding response OmpR family regulator